jgi:hypothetical protein
VLLPLADGAVLVAAGSLSRLLKPHGGGLLAGVAWRRWRLCWGAPLWCFFGVGLNDSRVVAPPLLCSGQRCSPVLRLQVVCPWRCCDSPSVELDLEEEDGGPGRVFCFLFRVLFVILDPYVILSIPLGLFVLQLLNAALSDFHPNDLKKKWLFLMDWGLGERNWVKTKVHPTQWKLSSPIPSSL